MRRRLAVVIVTVMATMTLAMGASADHNVGPCNDSGEPGNSDYATHHIVPANLGNDAHPPGVRPPGFTACVPQAGWKTHP